MLNKRIKFCVNILYRLKEISKISRILYRPIHRVHLSAEQRFHKQLQLAAAN